MTQIALDRWEWRKGSADFQAKLSAVAARVNNLPQTAVGGQDIGFFVNKLLDNRNVPSGYVAAILDFTPDHYRAFAAKYPEPNSEAAFPDRLNEANHIVGVGIQAALNGSSLHFYSDLMPGQGYTGTDDVAVTRSNNIHMIHGTIFHDMTSTYDKMLAFVLETDSAFADKHAAAVSGVSLNEEYYGDSDIVISALLMGAEAYFDSLLDGIIPPSEDLASFLGPWVTREDILRLAVSDKVYFDSVTKLGDAAGHLGATLAQYYGDSDFASQVVTASFAETLGGYLGDSITFEVVGTSLSADTIVSRFFSDFARSTSGLARNALTSALNEALDIESPLGQFVSSSITSAVTNVFLDEAIDLFDVDREFAVNVLGLGSSDLSFSRVVLAGEVLNVVEASFGDFLTGQLFSFLDELWTDFNLTNLGSSIGGIIGGFIAPGIGNFIGQVAGGIIFDLIDGDPRAFHRVSYDAASGEFVTQFVFAEDDGQVGTSQALAESAMGSIQLATILLGGTIQGVQPFEYGHYNEDLVYSGGGSGRVRFEDAEEMLARGVLAQLRTLQIQGGNEYAKNLLVRPGYNPSLDQFFQDIGVADLYDIHKADPYLFGLQMINIADAGARRFVLTDWQGTLAAAGALGFNALPISDGSEFLVRVGGDKDIAAGAGNDFIYAEDGIGSLRGGSGNDIIRFDSAILTNGSRDALHGDEGDDRYVGDFSGFVKAAGSDQRGISFYRMHSGWSVLDGPDALGKADFNDFEQFVLTGTRYADYVDFDTRVFSFAGGGGIDTVNLQLAAATSSVVLDIGRTDQQLIYASAELSGIEKVDDVITGSGNDTIRIGTTLLTDAVRNNIDANDGYDVFGGDFSSFVKAAGSDQRGISFYRMNSGWSVLDGPDGLGKADFNDFEQFVLTGTRYDDYVDFDMRVFGFAGGGGTDTVNLELAAATSSVVLNLDRADQQLIYASAELSGVEKVDGVVTGSGNDTIRIGATLLTDNVRNNIDANDGHDIFVGDFSAYLKAAGSDQKGISFLRLNSGWSVLDGPDGLGKADFNDFEQFILTGTRYGDRADFDMRVSRFVAGEGIDTVDLQLAAATSSVVVDLGRADQQLIYGSAELSGVEKVDWVVTGSGNDTIRIGSTLLTDAVRNNIDANGGHDIFVGDFSAYVKAAGSDQKGISFLRLNSGWSVLDGPDGLGKADFNDFEQFILTGTRYGDRVDFDMRVSRFAAGEGIDTVDLQLAAATSSVILDLGRADQQLIYGSAELSGVEKVDWVVTGSGNDTIRIGTTLLTDAVRNNIDANGGHDIFVGDFSAYVKAAGSDQKGINVLRLNSVWAVLDGPDGLGKADLNDFEQFLLTGTRYDDRIDGGGQVDRLTGGRGNDTLHGNDGSDSYVFNAGDGVDRIEDNGSLDADQLLVHGHLPSAVTLTRSGRDVTLRFAGSTDSITIVNTLEGDAGDQVEEIVFDDGTIWTAAYVRYLLTGIVGPGLVVGGAAGDRLSGTAGNDWIYAHDGDDVASGGAGVDRIFGGAGADTLGGDAGADIILGGDGRDTLHGGSENDRLNGGNDADLIHGAGGNDSVFGDHGDDRLFGSGGDDQVSGGDDNDQLFGDAGSDLLEGGAGDDQMWGFTENDTLNGGAGNDWLFGEAGYDLVRGGAGDDLMNGGDSADRASYDDAASGVTVDLSVSGPQNTGQGADTLVSIEHMTGSGFGDRLSGNAESNWLVGGGGSDTLIGRDGHDRLEGGAGNDQFDGGTGADTIEGGEGTDTAFYSSAATGVEVDLSIVGGQNTRGAGTDTLVSIENVIGSGAADRLIGNTGANWLIGNSGADLLSGDGGHDILWGGAGHDSVWGGTGDDLLDGGPGDDTIDGGAGSDTVSYAAAASRVEIDLALFEDQNTRGEGFDTLISIENVVGSAFGDLIAGNSAANRLDGKGGADVLSGFGGADSFAFTSAPGGGNIDRIADFVPGTDKIALGHAVFGLGTGALNPNALFLTGSAAHDGDDRIIYNRTTGALFFDADGNGAIKAVQFATVTAGLALTVSDFFGI